MTVKFYSICFALYLYITSTSIFNYEGSLYNLKTAPVPSKNKVCLIIVDGLRYDYVPYMQFISYCIKNKKALLYKSISGIPSYSRPGYERILTGSETSINGISSNENKILSLTPNLFYLCKLKKLTTSCSSYYWIKELYPLFIDYEYFYYFNDGLTFSIAEEFIKNYKPDFIVIHPMKVDTAGHRYGAKSLEYIEATKSIDLSIKKTWDLIKNDNYTMIITSDHGHKNEGGHGDECEDCVNTPFIIISSYLDNIQLSKPKNSINQTDIAPTICDLLGISKTIYMTGKSLIKNDDISAIRKAFAYHDVKNFKDFFYFTSILTYIILSFYTVIYFSSFITVIKILKRE
ncbi:hypothetical protein FDN13_11265 [Caloramator sp. E03]|uniref:alkaline phosphatase family protein n=1 Tax=Caloramator sp. E03 TaxID=2576307 RepID=UPI0011105138|nr:alkaline phosphatase family protein [Caloramator sp. E03]QCX34231.1 hypothetical protein FDN13_11265 [Caloramator sp. E03]